MLNNVVNIVMLHNFHYIQFSALMCGLRRSHPSRDSLFSANPLNVQEQSFLLIIQTNCEQYSLNIKYFSEFNWQRL